MNWMNPGTNGAALPLELQPLMIEVLKNRAIVNAMDAWSALSEQGRTVEAEIVHQWLLTQPVFAALMKETEALIARNNKTDEREPFSAECTAATARYRRFIELGEEDTVAAKRAFILAYKTSPQWVKNDLDKFMEEQNMIPSATGYLDDGTPVVSLDSLAQHLGISKKQAHSQIEQIFGVLSEEGLSIEGIHTNDNVIHRKH